MTVSRFVTNETGPVFALTGLPEEVIAVLFAYYSRSNRGLREALADVLREDGIDTLGEAPDFAKAAEKAKAFHEKWVVGYGHGSVAEGAIVHMGIEGCSILTAKAIEDARLASFTEQSTRYVLFDRNGFVRPETHSRHWDAYDASCSKLIGTYLDLMPQVKEAIEGANPDATVTAVKAAALDALRGLLPASTKTNLGLTANARTMEHLITKMLSSPLAETRMFGKAMKHEALKVVPTLLKYADRNDYIREPWGRHHWAHIKPSFKAPRSTSSGVALVSYQPDALARVATALVQDEEGVGDALPLLDHFRLYPHEARKIVAASVEHRGLHDAAPRAFEAATVTVELTLDYGAYRDLQRHRLLSPTVPMLTCALGYDVPDLVEEIGAGQVYRDAMDQASLVWEALLSEASGEEIRNAHLAQYAVPLGYKVKVLWTMNLREVFHVVELRSGKQGHPSYRRIAQDLYEHVTGPLPWLKSMMRVDRSTYSLARK